MATYYHLNSDYNSLSSKQSLSNEAVESLDDKSIVDIETFDQRLFKFTINKIIAIVESNGITQW